MDTLLRIETKRGQFLLAVEAQGKKVLDKPRNWAYYLAHLNAKYDMPAVLLVVCDSRNTAAWASEAVDFGPPEWPALTLRPLVLGPDNVPVIDDPVKARRDIPLTVLSAVLHRREPGVGAILKVLVDALKGLEARDPETATIFVELTSQGLGKAPAADTWRDLMTDLSFFTSPISEELRAEGRTEGRTQSKAEDILLLLDRRGVPLSAVDRHRITSCTDLDTLNRWFTRAITATSASEVFGDDLPGTGE
ncbi:hypothetical protein [Streptomyces sp. DSM 40750]|uniref:hypothetical protein n=1 Tax=Streptomyces sp. DSM 40750 TaxID=2801030 RepID=UPI00214BECB0|nr:hypothetical protein [Streptomyces sp. DSM 40750]UUU22754.1 hypothetical protein JIX55_22025 [Streptomyces sp. DSM 40750]